MSIITITIQKQVLEQHPELSYQLFYLSEKEEEQAQFYIYTPKGYYQEVIDLLDLYQLPYQIYSSRNILLLHILIVEHEQQLATELKRQLHKWGFGTVVIASDYKNWHEVTWKKHFSLAVIDNESLVLLSFPKRVRIMLYWLAHPLILLRGNRPDQRITYKPRFWHILSRTAVLYKPFTAKALQESVERVMEVVV